MDLLCPIPKKIIISFAYKQWESTTNPLGPGNGLDFTLLHEKLDAYAKDLLRNAKDEGRKRVTLHHTLLTLEKASDVAIERDGDFGWFKNIPNPFVEPIIKTKILKNLYKKTNLENQKF